MRAFALLMIDCSAAVLASLAALILRDNFQLRGERLVDLFPYLMATLASAVVFFTVSGLNRAIWRFSTGPDYLKAVAAMAGTVAGAIGICFAYDRLDSVARALPVLQFLTGSAFLITLRLVHRAVHEHREYRKTSASLFKFERPDADEACILVAGVNRMAELYLQAAAEAEPGQIRIAGLLGRADRHTGRLIGKYPVLGTPEEVETVIDNLETHGVSVDRVVVAGPFHALSPQARHALREVERKRNLELRFIAADLGLSSAPCEDSRISPRKPLDGGVRKVSFEVPVSELDRMSGKPFWYLKRAADFAMAVSLLIALSPLMLLTGILVALCLGWPVIFWQVRPGLGGRTFRLYKFRTMRSVHCAKGPKLSEDERKSRIGNFLRRVRADELPQLFSIIWGDMSFVGPRPLLPRDQSPEHCARLLVRPGLTGWAQVIGGRGITAEDKAALDVWYMRNASFALDVEILLRTISVVLFGERIRTSFIASAWRELYEAGVLSREVSLRLQNGSYVSQLVTANTR
jgi:lipopolysaccharide/colanic/teichoic acid biosynthesis glycosyltransferase